jgi:hypothetical protein
MSRIEIDDGQVWVSSRVYYHILGLKKKIKNLEEELELMEKKKIFLPLKEKVRAYKQLMLFNGSKDFRMLVNLLEEIAEFRITNKMKDKDKVIVILPEKSICAKALEKAGGSNE